MTRISYACATLFTLTALLCSCGRGVSDPAPIADPCRVAKPFDTKSYRELAGVDPNLLRLDIRGFEPPPSGCDAAPVVLYVHGGGWAIGDKANVDSKDTYFASLGYVFVSINYRLSPHPPERLEGVRHPAHVQDAAAAVRWVVEHIAEYGGDPHRLALLGHSAGAHLVALLGTSPTYLGAAGLERGDVRCVAAIDTEALDIPTALSDASDDMRATYENAFGTEPAVWTEASPITHVNSGAPIPPFFLVKRGSASRQALVDSFRERLHGARIPETTVDASGMTHAQVNDVIGTSSDHLITPALTGFFGGCLK